MPNYNLEQLENRVLNLLENAPRGLGEYELLKALQNAGEEGFPRVPLTEKLPLFQMHFLLFHVLYRLRERLWREERFHLEISPLKVVLLAYRPGLHGVSEYDPLQHYYGDIERLETTTEQDVAELLGKFWSKFHAKEKKQAALATLELSEPVDYATVKRRYRSLAMRHHPDRGGNTSRLQALNEAMAVLEDYYR